MTKRQYRSLVCWSVILVVSLFSGFALLFSVWRPAPFVVCALVLFGGIVVAMLLRTLRVLGQDVDESQSDKNPGNL